MKALFALAALGAIAVTSVPAQAAGCLSGAAVGGVAGHVAGHHGLLGAAAGCAIGHHEAAKNRRAQASQQQNMQRNTQPANNPETGINSN